jgi:hypothetical protein
VKGVGHLQVSSCSADHRSIVKSDIQVTCVSCGTAGSLYVQAAFDIDFLDSTDDLFTLSTASLFVELASDFNATANLELFAGASTSLGFTQSIFPSRIMITPFTLGGVLSVGPIFDFEVAMDIAGPSGSVNMTYGAELTVPKGAKANLTYAAGNQSTATGW